MSSCGALPSANNVAKGTAPYAVNWLNLAVLDHLLCLELQRSQHFQKEGDWVLVLETQ